MLTLKRLNIVHLNKQLVQTVALKRGNLSTIKYNRHYSTPSDHSSHANDSHHEEHHSEHHGEELGPEMDFLRSGAMKIILLGFAGLGTIQFNEYVKETRGTSITGLFRDNSVIETADDVFAEYQKVVQDDINFQKFWEEQETKVNWRNKKHYGEVPGKSFPFGNGYQEGLLDHDKLEPRRKVPEILYDEVK